MSKRKPLAGDKDIVLDDQGRRRFHGAFTGGFSAGYFNTVGSKEGFTPQTFVSSRRNRFSTDTDDGGSGKDDRNNQGNSLQKPEDFMDEEDGLLGAKLTTKDGFQMTKDVYSSKLGGGGGGSFTHMTNRQESNVKVNESNMGYKLLSTMGWKAGQGVGARIASKTIRAQLDSKYADHSDDDGKDDDDSTMMTDSTSIYLKSVPQGAVRDGRVTFAAPEVFIKLVEEKSLGSGSGTSQTDSHMYNHSVYEDKQSKSYLTLKRDQFGAGYTGNLLNELGQDLGDAAWSFAKSVRKVYPQHRSTAPSISKRLPELRNSTSSSTSTGDAYGSSETILSGGISSRRVHLSSHIDEEDVYATEDSNIAYDEGIGAAIGHSASKNTRDGIDDVDLDEVRVRADAVLQDVQRYPSDNKPVLEGYSLAANMEEVHRAFDRLSMDYPPLEVPSTFVAGHIFVDVPPPKPPVPPSVATIAVDASVTAEPESKVKRKSRFSRFQNLSKEELLYGPAFIALSPLQKQQLLGSVSLALVQQIYNRESVYRAANLLPPPSAQVNTFVQSAALHIDTTSTASTTSVSQLHQQGHSVGTAARPMLATHFDNESLKTALQSRFTTAGTTLLHQAESLTEKEGKAGKGSRSDILSRYTDMGTTTSNYSASSSPQQDPEPDWSTLETHTTCSVTDWVPSAALCKSLGVVPPVPSVNNAVVKVDKREDAFEKNVGQHISTMSTMRSSSTNTSNTDRRNNNYSGNMHVSADEGANGEHELDEFYALDLLDNDPHVSLYKAVFENDGNDSSGKHRLPSFEHNSAHSTGSTQPSKYASNKLADGNKDMDCTRILFRRPVKKQKASTSADGKGSVSAPFHMREVPSVGVDTSMISHSTKSGLSAESVMVIPSSGSSSDASEEEVESRSKLEKRHKKERKAMKKQKKKEKKELKEKIKRRKKEKDRQQSEEPN